ncbi:sodium:calcium antiporter [Haladaptatus sp. NG-WS-4]
MNVTAITPLAILPSVWEHTILLFVSFGLLLLGAEVFTNGVEWLGHRLGVSESATGSILAAVGTALPETMIPVIAIFYAKDASSADHVGVGAILGAPFMLATIAMFLVGSSVYYFSSRRAHGIEMYFNQKSTRRDLSFFLVGYSLAFVAALIPRNREIVAGIRGETFMLGIGVSLVLLYVYYIYRSLQGGGLVEEEGLEDLFLGGFVERYVPGMHEQDEHASDPHFGLVALQSAFALGIIVGGAHLFVTEVEWVSRHILSIHPAILALLIAPLATELPEKFNSVIWISRDKDTLALGNITGAMAFQGTLPVTLGIVYTSWNLSLDWGTVGFLNGLSALLAIVSGSILYLRARNVQGGNMKARPFLIGGLFYLLFILILVYHSMFLISADAISGGH